MNRFRIEENESESVTSPTEISEPTPQINIPAELNPPPAQPIEEDKFKVIELPPVNQVETFENEKDEINQNYVVPKEEEQEEYEAPPHKLFGHRGSQKNRNLQPTEVVAYEQKKKANVGLILLGGGLLATLAANFI